MYSRETMPAFILDGDDGARKCQNHCTGVSPLSLELASAVLTRQKRNLEKLTVPSFFPMADHLDFAVRRIQNGEQISNPLTDDIRVMFYKEYKVASCIRELFKRTASDRN